MQRNTSSSKNSASSLYGLDDSLLELMGVTSSPSSAHGSQTSSVRSQSTTVSASNYSGGSGSKGWFDMRVMLLSALKETVLAKTTMYVGRVVVLDHPCEPDGVNLRNAERVRLVDGGRCLEVARILKDKDSKATARLREWRSFRRGTTFEVKLFGSDNVRRPDKVDAKRIIEIGDVVRLCGMTCTVSTGTKSSEYGGEPRVFDSVTAESAQFINSLAQFYEAQTHINVTLVSWMVEEVPSFVRMQIQDGFDFHAAANDARQKKASAPGASAAPTSASDMAVWQPKDDRFGGQYHIEDVEASFDDQKEVGDKCLTQECKKFKWEWPDIYVPVRHVLAPVIQYLSRSGFPFTLYFDEKRGQTRLDPTALDSFRREKRPEKGIKIDPNAPKVYEPHYAFVKRVSQVLEWDRLTGNPVLQHLEWHVSMHPDTIAQYGSCDASIQMRVLPHVFAAAPCVLRCWINGRLSAKRALADTPLQYPYYLNTVTKRDNKAQPSVFGDLLAGIVSAGYRITPKAACDLLDELGKRPGYVGSVAADMSAPRIKKANQYAARNPLNRADDPVIINCAESDINYKEYGHEYAYYLVSNWAEKNFSKKPELREILSKIDPAQIPTFLSATFLSLARGTPLPAELASSFGPSHPEGTPQPTPAEQPFEYMIFAVRIDYLEARALENYHGDDAYVDVIAKNEAYLEKWIAAFGANKRLSPEATANDEEIPIEEGGSPAPGKIHGPSSKPNKSPNVQKNAGNAKATETKPMIKQRDDEEEDNAGAAMDADQFE